MSERKPRQVTKQRASLGFVLMLLLSRSERSPPSPSQVRPCRGRLASLTASRRAPMRGILFDTLEFSAEVTNYYASPSGASRTLTWYACEGDVTVAQCKSVFDDSGQFNIGNIPTIVRCC